MLLEGFSMLLLLSVVAWKEARAMVPGETIAYADVGRKFSRWVREVSNVTEAVRKVYSVHF